MERADKQKPKIYTTKEVQGLRAKATTRREEFRDGGGPNLYIVVQPNSGETSFVIRPIVNGKQKRTTIGRFPSMSLADARAEAARQKAAISDGKPLPGLSSPTKANGITVAQAWDLYWQYEASSRKSASDKQRIFLRDVAPVIGSKPLSGVTRQHLSGIISAKHQTAQTASNRLHSLLARFFKWCFTHGHSLTNLDSNPMDGVAKMHSERNSARKRYLTEQELGWWFQALPAAGEYAAIHELLMRTLCRFADILNLTWGEVVRRDNGDTVLEIQHTKNDQPHVAYLHPSAVRLLPKRPENAKREDRVFAVTSRSNKPVERIRKRMEAFAANEGRTVPHWQPHDYRRTGTTHLAGMMDEEDNPLVPHHVLDRVLAHKEQGIIRHYNIYGYYKEKKSALTKWNDKINELI